MARSPDIMFLQSELDPIQLEGETLLFSVETSVRRPALAEGVAERERGVSMGSSYKKIEENLPMYKERFDTMCW